MSNELAADLVAVCHFKYKYLETFEIVYEYVDTVPKSELFVIKMYDVEK